MEEFFVGLLIACMGFTLYWYVDNVHGEALARWIREKLQ